MTPWCSRILIIGLLHSSVYARFSVLEKQYRYFKDDLHLIERCFSHKVSICKRPERIEAGKALGRITARGLVVLGIVAGFIVGMRKTGQYFYAKHASQKTANIRDATIGRRRFNALLDPVKEAIKKKFQIDLSKEELNFGGRYGGNFIMLNPSSDHQALVASHLTEIIAIIRNQMGDIAIEVWNPEMFGWDTY